MRTNILQTATDFYENLYSSSPRCTIHQHQPHLEKSKEVPPFLIEEITKGIDDLQLKKTPGENRITIEMLKSGKEQLLIPLQNLFNKILTTEQIPNLVVKLPNNPTLQERR